MLLSCKIAVRGTFVRFSSVRYPPYPLTSRKASTYTQRSALERASRHPPAPSEPHGCAGYWKTITQFSVVSVQGCSFQFSVVSVQGCSSQRSVISSYLLRAPWNRAFYHPLGMVPQVLGYPGALQKNPQILPKPLICVNVLCDPCGTS